MLGSVVLVKGTLDTPQDKDEYVKLIDEAALACSVVVVPVLKIQYRSFPGLLDKVFAGIIFTSANAVLAFDQGLDPASKAFIQSSRTPVLTVGLKTAQVAQSCGFTEIYSKCLSSPPNSARSLAELIVQEFGSSISPFLFPCSSM
jgi:uroporphyrinogen-III synthase